jgi:hypothetical protein
MTRYDSKGSEDFITFATLLEIHLEKVIFFSVESQAAVLERLLDILLPVSELKVLLVLIL